MSRGDYTGSHFYYGFKGRVLYAQRRNGAIQVDHTSRLAKAPSIGILQVCCTVESILLECVKHFIEQVVYPRSGAVKANGRGRSFACMSVPSLHRETTDSIISTPILGNLHITHGHRIHAFVLFGSHFAGKTVVAATITHHSDRIKVDSPYYYMPLYIRARAYVYTRIPIYLLICLLLL